MNYEVNFGDLRAGGKKAAGKGTAFRLALLGDFSGGANRGRLETGAALAARKPLPVDCDNLEKVIARLKIRLALPLGPEGAAVELTLGSMDDFHPEQLYEKVEMFAEWSGLRQRLNSPATFAKAAAEVQSWAGTAPAAAAPAEARGSVIPAQGKLSDFSRLVGRAAAAEAPEPTLQALLRHLTAPYIVAAEDPGKESLVAAVDEALAGAMRSVLHHPDFQALEALWRSVDFLVRRLETDETLQIVLYDLSAEELAADLSQVEELQNSGLYQWLIEQPASDVNQGPLSAIVGLYTFERTPPHFELLGRLAKIVAEAPAAFFSSVDAGCLSEDPKELHPLIRDSWAALRALPEAGYLGLACPRFLLRLPYGEKTEPVDCFDFEEFTPRTGLRGMLWGNPAVIAALLLAQTFAREGMTMSLGSVLGVDEMPFYYYTDADGDQVALPCTERLITARLSTLLSSQTLIPLVCMKGAPEVRLGGFGSVTGKELGGPWGPIAAKSPPRAKAPPAAPEELPAAPPAAPEPAPEELTPDEPVPEASVPEAPAAAALESSPVPAEAAPEAAPGDAELDSLLADLAEKKEEKQEEAKDAEIDPELAALLADL